MSLTIKPLMLEGLFAPKKAQEMGYQKARCEAQPTHLQEHSVTSYADSARVANKGAGHPHLTPKPQAILSLTF